MKIKIFICTLIFFFISGMAYSDQWDSANNPERFDVELDYTLAKLPHQGKVKNMPWTTGYWPLTKGNTIFSLKNIFKVALIKYNQAFGDLHCSGDSRDLDHYLKLLRPLSKYTSSFKGNSKARPGKDSDSDGDVDECDDNDGVETWFGLCNAWMPAAMLEDKPLRSVEYNGVTFYPQDMEALLILSHRHDERHIVGGKGLSYNRYIGEIENRDTNAGAYHILLTNYLGIKSKAFAEDHTYDYEVCNQPVIAFNIETMEEINESGAMDLLEITNSSYKENFDSPNAVMWYDVKLMVSYLSGIMEEYSYILEVDEEGNIVGGEWYGESRRNHPDLLWRPVKTRSNSDKMDYRLVRKMRDISRKDFGEDVNKMTKADIIDAISDDSDEEKESSESRN